MCYLLQNGLFHTTFGRKEDPRGDSGVAKFVLMDYHSLRSSPVRNWDL